MAAPRGSSASGLATKPPLLESILESSSEQLTVDPAYDACDVAKWTAERPDAYWSLGGGRCGRRG
eukprot:6322853-Pyramimonas_sp.AAC.1